MKNLKPEEREEHERGGDFRMKQLRPKLSPAEIDLLIEAMEQAGYGEQYGNKWRLLNRFKALRKGQHTKNRIWGKPSDESPGTPH